MTLERLADALKELVSGVLETIRKAVAQFMYSLYRIRSPGYQRDHLPSEYSRYAHYHSTYGTAPGDAYDTPEGPVVVTDVMGPPHMNAKVTYIELEKDLERTVGLAAFYKKTA